MSIMYKSRGGTGKVAVKMNAMNEELIRMDEGNKKLLDILVVAKDHWLVAKEQWVNSENANSDEVAYLKLLVTSLKEQVREKNEQWDKLKILNDKKVTHIKDLSDENKNLKSIIDKFRMLPPGQEYVSVTAPCYLCKQENEKLKKEIEEMKTFIHGYKQNLVNNNSITGP